MYRLFWFSLQIKNKNIFTNKSNKKNFPFIVKAKAENNNNNKKKIEIQIHVYTMKFRWCC